MLFQPFQAGLKPVEKVDRPNQRLKPIAHDRTYKVSKGKKFFGLVLFRLQAYSTSSLLTSYISLTY